MRDLSVFERVPSSATLLKGIRDPARFRPEPRLVRKVEVRELPDGYGELVLDPAKPPTRLHPLTLEVHRALEDGEPFARMVQRAAPKWPGRSEKLVDRVLRSYMVELAEHGIVEIPFETPPAVFHGRYERVKDLGRGGMGIVHLCKDLQADGETVVVKHAWGWTNHVEKAERVNRIEAAALSLTDHPLVPRLRETFEVDGILHIVRDFAEGRPLTKGLRALAAGPAARRLAIARDVLDTLHHVHERGMLYMDVKPENFVLGKDGRARLVDLGLCRAFTGEPVKLRVPIGSRGYVAPEVVQDRVADVRSDVYSIGRALFTLATGEKPRQKWTADELAAQMRARGADEREVSLVTWLAAEDAAKRPATLAEPLARLDALLREEGTPAA